MDVDTDGVALDRLAPAVEPIFELGACQHRTWPGHQRLQHREFPRRQQHDLTVERDLPRGRVQPYPAVA